MTVLCQGSITLRLFKAYYGRDARVNYTRNFSVIRMGFLAMQGAVAGGRMTTEVVS